jgi:hypothetical protein
MEYNSIREITNHNTLHTNNLSIALTTIILVIPFMNFTLFPKKQIEKPNAKKILLKNKDLLSTVFIN